MTIEYEKKLAEMENVMRLQTDVIADLNKEITEIRADNAILKQEIESYKHDAKCLSADAARLRRELDDEMGLVR